MENETESQPPAKRKKVQKKLTSFFSTNAFIHSENEQSIELSEPSSTSSQPELDRVGISQKNFKDLNLSERARDIAETGQSVSTDNAGALANESCKTFTISTVTYPSCWSSDQYNYFTTTYPWIICENASNGCSICKNVKLLGLGASSAQNTHLSSE